MKFTKIVATISDYRATEEFVRALRDAGVNVFRVNSAHATYEGFRKIVETVRAVDPALGIMIDTKGPEVRTTPTATGEPVHFKEGDEVLLSSDPDCLTSASAIGFNYPGLPALLSKDDRMIIDDGEIALRIVRRENDKGVFAVVENDGNLGSRKTVNVPGVDIPLPSVSERDNQFIKYAVELGADFIAHSFVRSASDVKDVKAILESLHSEIKIISKIENQQGVDNFDEILQESYGIMVARGDLGIEVAAERIPGIQMQIINKCIASHKPVIVATQMLHTMIEHPRPTRAEVSDVANAVYQRADAMMLSGETASGKYPVEAVKTMARIACEVEGNLSQYHEVPPMKDHEVNSFLSRQAVLSEKVVGTKAVITDAHHGLTARYIASFRGSNPTIALCYNRRVERLLSLSYGVFPRYFNYEEDTSAAHHPKYSFRQIVDSGILDSDARVAYLSGNTYTATSLEIDTLSGFCKD